MKKVLLVTCTILAVACMGPVTSHAKEKQMVYGAGPSTKIVQLFFTEFEKQPSCGDYTFEVPPKSVKHAGGIKACEEHVFGRTGRPLNEKEKNMNKEEIFLGQVPIAIAVGSKVEIKSLNMDQLEKIVTGEYTNWKKVGGPDAQIVNVGREQTEALYSILKKNYPFYNSAKFTKIFSKDNHVVDFLKNPYGDYAISFGAEPNFQDIDNITILKLDNFSAGQQLGLVYDLSNKDNPLVKSAAQYASSKEWQQIVIAHGYLEPNK